MTTIIHDRKGTSIQTFIGNKFYPLDPRCDEVDIESIAHAIANKCRFSGHTSRFYSVAHHSVLVSIVAEDLSRNRGVGDPIEIGLSGLLHDASEAYLVDMPTPLKYLPEFKWFRNLENNVQNVVYERYCLMDGEPPLVKEADKILLATERRDFMGARDPKVLYQLPDSNKSRFVDPLPTKLHSLNPEQSEVYFLQRFVWLMENRTKW